MSPASAIRVILIDDHPVLRLGVAHGLASCADIHVLGQFAALADAHAQMAEADVVVLDYALPEAGMDGLRLIEFVARRHPAVKIISFTAHAAAATALQALQAGSHGFVSKEDALTALAEAIRQVHAGRRFLSPSVEARVRETREGALAADGPAVLSPREFEVARFLRQGLTVTEIAGHLNRSIKTVSAQKIALMRKLGANNDLSLMRLLLEQEASGGTR